jgi:hypothetical protein
LNVLLSPVSTILTGEVAGKQFDESNISYIESVVGMSLFSRIGISFGLVFLVLLAIWWRPLKASVPKVSKLFTATAMVGLLFIGMTEKADAYYDKSDYAEAYFILPNESAFYIPDVGANKAGQAAFGSEAYLAENKVAAKRFVIPHVKLENSGLFSNYYVPAGRLIIVDRTPYNREWVKSTARGTASRDESFPCQSSEGLDMTVGVSIASSVTEANAAKFLYYFGVNPPRGNRADPNVIFSSVFAGKSLAEVMDTVVRGKVQALVCGELSKRTLDKGNTEASTTVMAAIEKNVGDFLGTRGITLDYIGWADTFEFDKDVQRAINDKYVALTIESSLPVLQQQAQMEVKRGLAVGLQKGLPSFLPPSMADWISGFFRPDPAAAKK